MRLQARFPEETKAAILVSPSFQIPLASMIAWNPACYACSGGNCTWCSDTPVGLCGEGRAMREWTIPSLIVTSEFDGVKAGAYRGADLLGTLATTVTFKDSVLDLATPITKMATPWGPFLTVGFFGTPFWGLRRHFALGDEANDVSHEAVVPFLKKVFAGGPDMVGSDKMYKNELNSRAPDGCCHPFPLFLSCCEC